MNRAVRVARTLLPPLAALIVLLGAWQLYVDADHVSSLALPSPTEIAHALWTDRSTLAQNLRVTAEEIILGLGVASLLAGVFAALQHFSQLARRALYPLLAGSQALPVVIVAPVLVLWLGFGILPKLIIIGLVCFFPIVVTTMSALESVDPDLLKLLRSFDASRGQVFRRVELPAALPGLFTGLKLAAVFSVIGAVFAEQAGATSGLGYLMSITLGDEQPAETFAAVVVLSVFAIALFALLTAVERRFLPWAYRQKTRQT